MSRSSDRRASVNSPFLLEHDPPLQEVGGRVDEHALGLEAVAPGAARLLLIVLERLRRAGMHDEAHVGAVDPHPERHRGDDDVGVLVEEGVLIAAALAVAEAGMVRPRAHARFGQPRRQRIDFLPGRAIDDAGLALAPGHHVEDLPLQAGAREHAVDEVRPIERADELERVLEPELRGDVAAHAGGRGRGVRVQADAGKVAAQPAELAVLRPKVVPPLADAVRLVDGDELDVALREPGQEPVAALAHEAFGRDVEQAVAPLAHPGRHRRLLVRAERAVVERRRHAVADERVHLILHQRDERRHDHAPAPGARAPGPGSTATCRRRSGARRPSRDAPGWPPWPGAGAGGTTCSPSSAR